MRSACSNTTSMSCSVNSTPIDCSRAMRAVSRISLDALARRHAGGRLVHQQQFRLVGERDRELEPLEVAIGKLTARTLGIGAHADEIEQPAGLLARVTRASSPRD